MKTIARLLFLAPLTLPAVVLAQQIPQQMPQPGAYGTGPISTGYIDVLAGLVYTDNARLSKGGGRNDGIGMAGLDVDYARQGRLRLDLLGNIDRLQYIRKSFSGSFYGEFNGEALWGRASDPVQWLVSDSFGEGMTDPLSAPTLTNLQTVNYLTTGPYLNLHFGLTNRFTLYGLYARSSYQRAPYDSQTYQGGAQFSHQLSGATSLSLHASDARTEYVERATLLNTPGRGAPYDVKQVSINFKGQYIRTNVSLAGGYSTIDYGNAQHGSPYYRVQLSRRISPFSTVFIGAESFYSNLGAAMQSPTAMLSAQVGVGQGAGYLTSLPFKAQMDSAGWTFQRARTTFGISGGFQQDRYDQQRADDHQTETGNVTIGRLLTRTVSLQLNAYGSYNDYPQLNAHTHQFAATLSVTKRLARTMFALFIRRTQQSGSPGQSNFSAASYHDDEVGVYMTYDLAGQRSGGGAAFGMGGLRGVQGVY